MNLHILAIGKKKSEYDSMIKEYQKRIVTPFSLTLEILEPLGLDNPNLSKTKECEKILSKIKETDCVVALDELGKNFTTTSFSQWINKHLIASPKRIVFILGGAYGLNDTIKERANLVMCLGSLTLPHELARLLICEQLYRVTNLLSGGKYHHH
jgi:23S rRNA (pseudouridine1915-N3)-methyltransferase